MILIHLFQNYSVNSPLLRFANKLESRRPGMAPGGRRPDGMDGMSGLFDTSELQTVQSARFQLVSRTGPIDSLDYRAGGLRVPWGRCDSGFTYKLYHFDSVETCRP